MTGEEIVAFVIARWLADHAPTSIMLQLITLGQPVKKAEVLAIIRRYVDRSTENAAYRRHV